MTQPLTSPIFEQQSADHDAADTQALDLGHYHWKYYIGDLTLIGTWIFTQGRYRPCMVLIRDNSETDSATIPCVITVDKAWIWEESIGDPHQAARTALHFAHALRLTPTRSILIRIASIIHDHLGDLLSIPPYQPRGQQTIGDIEILNHTTGETHQQEVNINV